MSYRRQVRARPANLDRPSWQWSHRDWRVFKASCHRTPRREALARMVVARVRSGWKIEAIASRGEISRAYVYEIMASEQLRDEFRMARFYERRGKLGRPLDVGGPRDEWIERDLDDEGLER